MSIDSQQNLEHLNHSFAAGGEEELEQAIDLFGAPLFRYCHTIVCDYYEAQDITQNVFIKAYQKRHTFKDKEGASLSAWLYKIAYRTCIDHLRRKKITLVADHEKIREERASSGREEGFSEEILFALQRLTPKERAVIFGRAIEEMEYRELAVICDCSEAALRKRYERARKKLAALLEEQGSSAQYGTCSGREEKENGSL